MKIELCLLDDIQNEEDFRSLFSCSKQFLKKVGFKFHPILKGEVLSLQANIVNHLKIFPIYSGPEVVVLFENADFLVIDKPSDIHVHPLSYCEEDNCLSYLRSKRPELMSVNEEHWDRGLLYRLDYGTSGVLFYVKNNEKYKELRKSFSTIAREKKYYAVVTGHLNGEGELKEYLRPFGPAQKQMKITTRELGDEAILNYRAINYNQNLNITLVEVLLKTGLRHQIRVQLAHLGFPILGDVLYGGEKSDRLYLHAGTYRIEDTEVSSPLPLQFQNKFKA